MTEGTIEEIHGKSSLVRVSAPFWLSGVNRIYYSLLLFSTILSPITSNRDPSADLVGQFVTWCKDNKMVCNPSKCKELVVRKKNHNVLYSPINNIPQCNSFVLLGVTLQSDGKFNEHVRTKLVKANKCLHVLQTLRKERYSQAEIDHFLYLLFYLILAIRFQSMRHRSLILRLYKIF